MNRAARRPPFQVGSGLRPRQVVFDEGLQFLANLCQAFGWLRALASSSREAGDGGLARHDDLAEASAVSARRAQGRGRVQVLDDAGSYGGGDLHGVTKRASRASGALSARSRPG